MKPEYLENAVVYLADAKAEFRRLMQDALRGYSFREVRAFPGLGEFKNALAARVPLDLIIVDADLPDGDVFETIAQMRNGDLCYNPFVPVITLAWNTEGAVIGDAIDSGVDSIVAAPIAAGDVFKRILSIINDRKPFVVTSDYIGPDRRASIRRDASVPLIDVPNTLRAKALGRNVMMSDLIEQIEGVMADINDQRLVRQSYQVALTVELIIGSFDQRMETPVFRGHVQRLVDMTLEISHRIAGSRFEHAGELCINLMDVAISINENWRMPSPKDMELLKPLSDAILASFNPAKESADTAGEIANMVARFSGKLDEQAKAAVGSD